MEEKKSRAESNQSVTKALSLLEAFTVQRPYLRLKELSEITGLNPATALRLLTALMDEGFVAKEEGRYSLGWRRFLALEGVMLQSIPIRRKSIPYLEQLALLLRRNVNLGVLDGREVVYLHRAEGEEGARGYYHVGMRRPGYCTALGKVLLSDKPELAASQFADGNPPKATLHTVTEKSRFLEQLERALLEGFAMEFGECVPGYNCVAVPIRGRSGGIEAALSISGAQMEFGTNEMRTALPYMRETAQRISMMLETEH